MPEDRPSRVRLQLGSELLAARTLSGLSQRTLGDRIGVSQSYVARVERGQRVLDRDTTKAYLRAVKADATVRERVLALTAAAHTETRTWAELQQAASEQQDVARERNAAAALIRNWQPTVLPGLAQTADYARVVIPLADVAAKFDHAQQLAGRIDRQGVLRAPDGPAFEFLIAARLLHWEPAPGVLGPQLAHLAAVAALPSVTLGVLPEDYAGAVPWHNFVLRVPADGTPPYVVAELVHGEQRITDPDSVDIYDQLWKRMWSAAATGPDASALIEDAH